ncbi:hypothetical protein HQ520_18090 [bacterium]|nr:hypothetical protein [bacterium]
MAPVLVEQKASTQVVPHKPNPGDGAPDSPKDDGGKWLRYLLLKGCRTDADEAGAKWEAQEIQALVHRMQPKDEIERVLVCGVAALHSHAMVVLSAAAAKGLAGMRADGDRALAAKLLRTLANHVDVLKRYRTGGKQSMTVHHVHVGEGGQAIVGNVERGGEG